MIVFCFFTELIMHCLSQDYRWSRVPLFINSFSLRHVLTPFPCCFIYYFSFVYIHLSRIHLFLFFPLTAAPRVSISLRSLVICIQTLTGCFPPKRLVDLGPYASLFSGVSVRICSSLLCLNVTTSVPFYHTFHPVLIKRVMLNY